MPLMLLPMIEETPVETDNAQMTIAQAESPAEETFPRELRALIYDDDGWARDWDGWAEDRPGAV